MGLSGGKSKGRERQGRPEAGVCLACLRGSKEARGELWGGKESEQSRAQSREGLLGHGVGLGVFLGLL